MRSLVISLLSLLLLLSLGFLVSLYRVAYPVLELLPRVAIQAVAELAIPVHLPPAVTPPLASSHVDQEIAILFPIVNMRIIALFAACSGWKGVDFALMDEGNVRTDPRLALVHVFKRILFLVLPFHVFLLIANWVPPNIQQSVSPNAPSHEERTKIKATAVLRYNHVDGADLSVAYGRLRLWVQIIVGEWMGNVKWIVDVDVSVCDILQLFEYVLLERVLRFHDEGIGVQPPEPVGC